MTENTVKTIKKLANNDEGFTNVKSGATNVLGTLGTMNSGSSAEDSGSLPEVTAVRTLNYLTHWTKCLYKVCISIIQISKYSSILMPFVVNMMLI